MKWFVLVVAAAVHFTACGRDFTNGGFEAGLQNWSFWTREQGAGEVTAEGKVRREGRSSARIDHHGDKDWSFEPHERLSTQPGELYELTAWVRLEGEGTVSLCASTWDAATNVVEWIYGQQTAVAGADWHKLECRFATGTGVAQIQPRFVGTGKATAWIDGYAARKLENTVRPRAGLAKQLSLTNQFLELTLLSDTGCVQVRDRRTGRLWKQSARIPEVLLHDASVAGPEIRMKLVHAPSGLNLTGSLQLSPTKPEFSFGLDGAGRLPTALPFPFAFESAAGDYLVVPMNEGISYPVEDQSIELFRLIGYGGHGICMPFWGVTDGTAGHLAIIETPDDAAIRMHRVEGRLVIAPEWDAQKGQFGYERRLRYVFFDQGGHVAIAKRYRAHARERGLLVTLREKRRANENVDLLIGAVNVWCWDNDGPGIVRELQAAGIERILWSNRQKPEQIKVLNELGVLTSRYDIYQDVMDPAQFDRLQWTHPDWTTAAWPKDIIIGANGKRIQGWGVEAKDGGMVSCGVICDSRALDYARNRVPAELASHAYRSRFIDTTTAAPWNECYDPKHPMTRTESKRWKMELLRYMSQEQKLVTGCETGHEASVPYLHY
ncbi:MAG TPA: glycoside hydrolase, partial [Clostridia bacterium]|nr:glycoside hydrolase [Clostridia bacterium]